MQALEALGYSGAQGTLGLEVLFSADSRVLRSQAFKIYLLSSLIFVIES